MTAVRGLDAILNGGIQFITLEDGKPLTLLFIDWYEDLAGIREHYEASLNPRNIRCPGRDVCPLCTANPGKYPSMKIKFRVYDPVDQKVKFVSLAKTHIQKLNSEFNLEEIDPTQNFVTIYRSGSNPSDTSYSARAYRPNPVQDKPELQIPNFEDMDIFVPSIEEQLIPHSPEAIQGFMNASLEGTSRQQQVGQQQNGQQLQDHGQFQQQDSFYPPIQGQQFTSSGRKLPF